MALIFNKWRDKNTFTLLAKVWQNLYYYFISADATYTFSEKVSQKPLLYIIIMCFYNTFF